MKKFYVLIFVIFIIVIVKANNVADKEKNVEPQKILDLGVTYAEFVDGYNEEVQERRIRDLALREVHWKKKGDIETFFYYIGDSVVVSGDVDKKTDGLLNISVSCEPERSKVVTKAALVHAIAICTVAPETSKQDLERISDKLSMNLKNSSVTVADKKYSSRIYNDVLMLSIEPKK